MSSRLATLSLFLALAANPLLAQTATPKVPAAGSAHADEVRHVAFDASGKWLVSMDGATVKSWTAADGKRVAQVAVDGGASIMRCSPTEPLVAILRNDSAVEVRTIPELKVVRSWPTQGQAKGIAFRHDGQALATSAYGGVRFWSTATAEPIGKLEINWAFYEVAYSPDGQWLATIVRRDPASSEPRIVLWKLDEQPLPWGVQANQIGAEMGWDHDGAYRALSFTADSKLLVAAASENDPFSAWYVPSGKPAAIRSRYGAGGYGPSRVTSGADPSTLLSADRGRVRVWSLADGKEGAPIEVPPSIARSPQHTVFARERLGFEAHQGQIRSIALSPDGAILTTGGEDRGIRLWSLADGSMVRELIDVAIDKASVAKGATAVAKAPIAPQATSPQPGLVVSGRLVSNAGKPVANFALKLPLAYPDEKGGLFLSFGPHFYEATTGADGRFRFEGVKPGERYALVDMSAGRPSYLKRADGSTLLLEFSKDIKSKNIDLGDIPVEFR